MNARTQILISCTIMSFMCFGFGLMFLIAGYTWVAASFQLTTLLPLLIARNVTRRAAR